MEEHGIGEDEFLEWLEDAQFTGYLYRMAERDAASKAPEVWQTLYSEAMDGNIRAIKLYFDICTKERGGNGESGDTGRDFTIDAVRAELFGDE